MNPLCRKTTSLAVGTMAACVHGCAGKPPTDEEQEEISQTLETGRIAVSLAKELVLFADPLFDQNGHPVSDNALVADSFDELVAILDRANEERRIRVFSDIGETEVDPAGRSTASGEAGRDDDLISVDASFLFDESIFYHEAAHSPYGPHRTIEAGNLGDLRHSDRDRIEGTSERRDYPYLVGEIMGLAAFPLGRFGITGENVKAEELQAMTDDELRSLEQALLSQQERRNKKAVIDDVMARDYPEELNKEDIPNDDDNLTQGEEMALFGISREEYGRALWQSDLFEAKTREIERDLERVRAECERRGESQEMRREIRKRS